MLVLVPGGIRQFQVVDLAIELRDPVVLIGVAIEAHRQEEDVEGRQVESEAERTCSRRPPPTPW
jgi:hypothetical protein